MPVLKLRIDKVDYEVECKQGEQNLLRKVEILINKKIDESPQFKSLPTSKMFLMISLMLAGELNVLKNENDCYDKQYEEIMNELEGLEQILEKKNEK
tara:strand:+ start:103 stop:393 length:291 start_codon:yes stop_codon:yes gene_type:complete